MLDLLGVVRITGIYLFTNVLEEPPDPFFKVKMVAAHSCESDFVIGRYGKDEVSTYPSPPEEITKCMSIYVEPQIHSSV